ncbi:hypothetical protein V5O48_017555, partial [Marasmius crinis-equi]
MDPILLAVALLFGASLWFARKISRNRNPPLPPGPPKDPLIGHMRIIPAENTSEAFHEWTKTYGDVICLEVLGRKLVILGSVESARAILENRGANYSCRPKFPIFELAGWFPQVTFLQYGERFTKHRKMLQQYFGTNSKDSLSFEPIIADEAHVLVKNLASAAPGTHRHYVHRFTVSNIMRVLVGHQIRSDDDVFLEIANSATAVARDCGPPGNTPVDFFPWLRHLPSWFPGTYYATVARSHYKTIRKLYDFPVEFVKAQKDPMKCFLLEKLQELEDAEDPEAALVDIKGVAAAIFAGGEDTTYSSLQGFYLAMLHHPESQKRAYEEIISVVGESSFPDVKDHRESLPLVECIVQEVLRWHTVAPLCIPHRAINDDVYNGMFIPKDAVVIPNIRGMSLNEDVYSNPHAFDPTRFLPRPEGREEPHFSPAFGFGRRVCPGRHFAHLALWQVIACTLATLEIVPMKGQIGNLPEMKFAEGLVREPVPFEYEVRFRSEGARRLVEQVEYA